MKGCVILTGNTADGAPGSKTGQDSRRFPEVEEATVGAMTEVMLAWKTTSFLTR